MQSGSLSITISSVRDNAVREAMWQVEQLLGPLSRDEVAGDDDRNILEHNLRCVIGHALEDYRLSFFKRD